MVKKRSLKKTSIKKRSSIYAPSSILGKIVSFWFLITITWMVLQSYVLKINLSNDILNIWVISFLLLPFLGAIVAWKNSEPENDGFFSRTMPNELILSYRAKSTLKLIDILAPGVTRLEKFCLSALNRTIHSRAR